MTGVQTCALPIYEGCAIERSTDGVVWSQVYFCPADDANGKSEGAGTQTVKLYDHDHATAYYFRVKHVVSNGTTSPDESSTVAISPTSVTTLTPDRIAWVTTTGDDATGVVNNESFPFATIQEAFWKVTGAAAGSDATAVSGLVLIKAGTYTEVAYADTGVYGYQALQINYDGDELSLMVGSKRENTEAKPVVIRSDIGLSASDVVIDANYVGSKCLVGFTKGGLGYKSKYTHLKNVTLDRAQNIQVYFEDDGGTWSGLTSAAINPVLEGLILKRGASSSNQNVTAIRSDACSDLVVRNCDIEGIRHVTGGGEADAAWIAFLADQNNSSLWTYAQGNAGGGIYGYAVKDGGWLIENNYIHDARYGIQAKDIGQSPPSGATAVVARYNTFENNVICFESQMGTGLGGDINNTDVMFRLHNNVAKQFQTFITNQNDRQCWKHDVRNNYLHWDGGAVLSGITPTEAEGFGIQYSLETGNNNPSPELWWEGNISGSSTAGFDFAFRNPDRKSTRLNSSHGYISYAVFCLKKQK